MPNSRLYWTSLLNNGEVAGVVALWGLVLRVGGSANAIPENQWRTICQAMMNNPQHDGMPGGTMMNSGPSSWEDGPEQGQCDYIGVERVDSLRTSRRCVVPTVGSEYCTLHANPDQDLVTALRWR